MAVLVEAKDGRIRLTFYFWQWLYLDPLVFDPVDDGERRHTTSTGSPSKKQTLPQFQAHINMAKYEAESGFCEGWVFDSAVRLGVLDLLGFFVWYGYAAYGAPGLDGMVQQQHQPHFQQPLSRNRFCNLSFSNIINFPFNINITIILALLLSTTSPSTTSTSLPEDLSDSISSLRVGQWTMESNGHGAGSPILPRASPRV